jgi:nitroreductase
MDRKKMSNKEFKKPVADLIKIRISTRSYTKEKLKPGIYKDITRILSIKHNNIFNSRLRFVFIDATGLEPNLIKNLGTYGLITDAKYFIAGITREEDAKYGIIDFGYVFEKIILYMTDLGLGTCWLGGTFNKKGFSDKAGLKSGELLPGVSPVGYGINKRRFKDSAVRMFAGSDRRKSWDKLFFNNSFSHPLEKDDQDLYSQPLEMIRLGPSASNMQPWRIIREEGNIFHFFMKRSSTYSNKPDHLNLQYIDMGICMCHFRLTAEELGLEGKWQVVEGIGEDKRYNVPPNTEYIISWIG